VSENSRLDDLRRRVQLDPSSIAFAQLAEEYRRAAMFQEAVDVCNAGLVVHPAYLSARVTRGRALIELQQFDDALLELQHVLQIAPDNLAAIRGLADIYHRRGSLAEALAQYRAALAIARHDPDLEQTVADLSRQIDPQPSSHATGGPSAEPERVHALATVAALEQLLTAVHVARAERRA
jgi:tetratricopeptide (TPR) repeat protein